MIDNTTAIWVVGMSNILSLGAGIIIGMLITVLAVLIGYAIGILKIKQKGKKK